MEMIDKETFAKYLLQNAVLRDQMWKHPDLSSRIIFYNVDRSAVGSQYSDNYDNIKNAFSLFLTMKMFSMNEDYLLNQDDLISNDTLTVLDGTYEILSGCNNISNKKMIILVRNAFNHNDSDEHERFSVCDDFKHVVIDFLDIRTDKERDAGLPVKPLRAKISVEFLQIAYQLMNINAKNIFFESFEIKNDFELKGLDLKNNLDQISFWRYYRNKKLTKDEQDEIKILQDTSNLSMPDKLNRSIELKEYLKSIGSERQKLSFSEEQKAKVMELCKYYIDVLPELFTKEDKSAKYYILNQVVPIPFTKKPTIKNQYIISNMWLYNPDYSLDTAKEELICFMDQYLKKEKDVEEPLSIYFQIDGVKKPMKFIDIVNLYRDMFNESNMVDFPYICFIDYVMTTIYNKDTFTIDGIEYERERIRNSFVHGRWFINGNQEIVFYDTDLSNKNALEIEFVGRFKIGSLINWAEKQILKDDIKKRVR